MKKQDNISTMEVVNLSSYTTPEVVVTANEDWVSYGLNNDHFESLIGYYEGSTTSGSIINGLSGLIYGAGLKATDSGKKPSQWASLKNLVKRRELKKIIFDRKLLGMAAIKVSYKKGKVSAIKHWRMETLRAEKADDSGDINNYYWSADWSEVDNDSMPKSFPAFGKGNGNQDEIYIVKPYVTGSFYYSQPDYAASLPYAELESQIGDYLINDVTNGFSGSLMVNFNNGVPSKEVQRLTNRKVVQKFTGSKGDKLLFNYNKNAESATTIERLALDNAPDHYQYLSDECRNKIIVGHRITSPLLIGIRESGNGFGSNADEIETATVLMDKVVVKQFQDEILDALDDILSINEISLDLYFASVVPRDFTEEIIDEDEETSTELSSCVALNNEKDAIISQELISKGVSSLDGYVEVDSSDVDYELEEELDAQINELNKVELSVWEKIVNLVSTGTARPNAKSAQDKEIDGVKFKVRYRYSPQTASDNSREFCQKMVSANKLYRKEDIIAMSGKTVNAGFGLGGNNQYSIWDYKGGARCNHKWQRVTFASESNVDTKSPLAPTTSTNKAERDGYRVRNNPNVSMKPNDMPNNGFAS
tara:strand:+ start:13947 stop:15722 length:1776 start_codon:yes stop_codon:yes gene_type:complete